MMPYKNPEKQREADRRWREANPEKVRETSRKWREASPERQREATRRWHEANPEKGREQSRRWREANLERARARRGYRTTRAGLLFRDDAQGEAEAVPWLAQAFAAQHDAQVVARRTTNKERIANSLRRDIEVDVVIVTGQAPVLGAVNDRALWLGLDELSTHGLNGSPEPIVHTVADLVGSVTAPSGDIISHGSLLAAKRSSGKGHPST